VCSDAQIAADASWQAAQRVARSDAHIMADANRRAVQRTARNDV